jgi:TM2 domain-containing membrane protein YozV
MYKIIGSDGIEYGPVTLEQVREWLRQGRVGPQTQVRREPGTEWNPLSTFDEFKTVEPVPPLVRPKTDDRASKKVAAGVCGILIAPLGIHKFILGYTGTGIIMLLGTVLTCGLAAPVFGIIGLIEGIIYLSKSDEEFVKVYVDGRKEWF